MQGLVFRLQHLSSRVEDSRVEDSRFEAED